MMKEVQEAQLGKVCINEFPPWMVSGLVWGFSLWPYRVIRIALCVVFFWSGISKLLSPQSFEVIIEAYGLIPNSWLTPVSFGLPALEVVLAVGLLLDIRGSLLGTAVLLAVFMAILGYGIHLGLDVDCGCFGPEDPEAEAFHGLRSAFNRDLVMAGGILYLYIWRYVRSAKPVGFRQIMPKKLKRRV